MKYILAVIIPLLIAASPVIAARLQSYFCDKEDCNDANWMSEGAGCGHGALIWGTFATIPIGAVLMIIALIGLLWK